MLERHGRLDVLVNNAGGQFLSPAEAITPKGFRTVIELNVQGTWLMTHAAATKAFIPQGGGKVLSVTLSPHNGIAGDGPLRRRPGRGREHDADALGRVGALRDQDLRPRRRAVRHRDAAHQVPAGGRRQRRSTDPARPRSGTEEEMAWLVAYLASPAGDFFSGCVITIDGARDNWFGGLAARRGRRRGRRAARRGAPAEGLSGGRLERELAEPPVSVDRGMDPVGRPLGLHLARVVRSSSTRWNGRTAAPALRPIASIRRFSWSITWSACGAGPSGQ